MAIIDRVNQTADVQLEHLQYPVPPTLINDLVELLRTEWTRSDYDWLEAMHGDYDRDLRITSVIARLRGRAIATASVMFARHNPEVALLANVLTRQEYRGHGIGGRVVEAAVELAAQVGCRICLLGTQAVEGNIYRRHGFDWHRGVVMRRQLSGAIPVEAEYFRPGQPTIIRTAHWGDLAGVTLLAIQRLKTVVLDYSRGLISGQSEQLERCVSLFPLLMADVRMHGGTIAVLVDAKLGRVFGFATASIGAGAARRHTAVIDVAVHDEYSEHAPALAQWLLKYCEQQEVVSVHAYVSDLDSAKQSLLEQAGFESLTKLRSALIVNGEASDVVLMHQTLASSAPPRSTTGATAGSGPQLTLHDGHERHHVHTGFVERG